MDMPQGFNEALQNGDVSRLKIFMDNSLLLDPTFRQFDAMYAEASKVPGLVQQFNGDKRDEDKAHWNNDFLSAQMGKLDANFCPERINFVKEVINYVKSPAATQAEEQKLRAEEKAVEAEPDRLTQVETGNILDKLYYSDDKAAVNRAADETAIFYGGGTGVVVGAAVAASITAASGATITWCIVIGAICGIVVGYLVKQRAS